MSVIPIDKRDGYIWFDGKMVPWQETTIHVLNHGLHYASTVFEGLRAYDGQIFKLQEHSNRLIKSGNILGLEIPYSVDQINKATIETVKINNIKNGYIRPIAWKGSETMRAYAPKSSIHLAIAAWELDQNTKQRQQELNKGIRMIVAKWARPAPNTAPVESKAPGLYMISTLSKEAAMVQGYDDALMLDYRGYVADGTRSNIFMVKRGVLHTPKPDCILNGITRQTIIKLAKDMNIEVKERFIHLDELGDAEEVFLTGTVAEITPVQCIDKYKYFIGPVTQNLIQAFNRYVHIL